MNKMAYDVFISFKNTAPGGGLTKDRAIAERLHSKLRDEGLNVFFSEKDLSTTAFMNEIYTALDQAKLLILVATSVDHVQSQWVRSEWQNFLGAINSGKKPDGQIITVLDGMRSVNLPIEISNFQSFSAKDIDGAVDFAFASLGKIKNSDVIKRMAQEEEQKRKAAEQEKLEEMRKRMEAERAAYNAEKKRQKAELAAANAKKKLERVKIPKKDKKTIFIARIALLIFVILVCLMYFAPNLYENYYNNGYVESTKSHNKEKIKKTTSDFNFIKIKDGYTLASYNGTAKNVVIPSSYKGQPVIKIGNNAFKGNINLQRVIIPDSVITIGHQAFYNCRRLTSIKLPAGLTSIEYGAFQGCRGITSITIPEGVTSIGDKVFYNCSRLASITLPNSLSSIGDTAFYNCDSLKSITIPEGVTSIGDQAFYNCKCLTSITIPEGVTSIGVGAFDSCINLTEISAYHPLSYYSNLEIPQGCEWVVNE